jgi:hypothetical protein
LLLAGCAADPPPPRGEVLAEVVARVSPREKRLTFERPGAPGFAPQSVDTLPIVADGVAGSGPANTVELVTTSIGDTFAGDTCPGVPRGQGAFCADVTLGQFYGQPLDHVFVQITSIADTAGRPFPGHASIDSDPAELGLDASLGLWKYTSPGAATPGTVGAAPDNSASRSWVFANPDDADWVMGLRVLASLTYASYQRAPAALPFVDACASGTNLGQQLTTQVTLPFAFTLYDTTTTTLTLNRRGVIVAGSSALVAPAKAVKLPASGNVPGCSSFKQCAVPRPAIFAFWDGLLYLGPGALCTQELGTAPNRSFAVTWSHMSGSVLADLGSDYTFTAVLHEGTDVIDLLYGQMLGPAPDASGGAATVGVQNAAGTVATSANRVPAYGTGAAYTFTPVP